MHVPPGASPPDPAERLTRLYREHAPRVLGFLLRRGAADAAPDLLSEVFATAWRRVHDVPEPALPWLLGVARNTLAHHWRSQGQQAALALSAAHAAAGDHRLHRGGDGRADVSDTVAERSAVVTALAGLSDEDREVLLLVGWDGLSSSEAAAVFGCAPGAFAVRLHRARRRLERALDPPAWSAPPPPPRPRHAAAPAHTTTRTPARPLALEES
ncbi:RNA polymerase sigma-70 factor, ECF subfamily [Quadrisphaera granulorum]|uniref:RNA polymerase sigma-70 factor (ECF subfamily) n=1 Tax=Quadrisphaera granulorum TaxID=317664 RepID=A0A316A0S6_9ACTN|nr:sigma-70 family RNA polymerase sigma factor [Quadrisphaera granulorum]PWJ51193.1 RNA polymerase sigma-70 factor (ECF subfamily) [Quadrisphaera granulorum]SZE97843.1 RNA polymerase sigma-70 factor, ECF subfamily [Quadrisphaera granulorum]